MEALLENLQKLGVLTTPRLISAFAKADRAKFVSRSFQASAYDDRPLPIGHGQTISQPYTVAFMLELLQPKPGQKILDIGSGSGWTTALLACVAGKSGHVWGIELVPELYRTARRALAAFDFQNITLLNRSGWAGYAAAAPYDRILVSAAAQTLPPALLNQLAINGRLVIPVGSAGEQAIKLFAKQREGKVLEADYPGFVFVPFFKN